MRTRSIALLTSLVCLQTVCHADPVTEPLTHVFVTESKTSGIPAIDSDGPSPANIAEIEAPNMGGSLTTGYSAMAEYSVEGFTALKTTTSLSIFSEADEESWSNVKAGARAVSSLATFGVVDGADMANPFGGTVEFHWTVEGNTFLKIASPMDVSFGEFSASTKLEATSPAITSPGPVFDESRSLSGEGEIDHDTLPTTFLFEASWTGNDPVPIFFNLDSQLKVDVSPTMAGKGIYTGDLATEFGNTARLEVVIKDSRGMVIDGAGLTPVPEPSSFTFFGLLCLTGGFARWRQNVS